jgi:hypothetical protein
VGKIWDCYGICVGGRRNLLSKKRGKSKVKSQKGAKSKHMTLAQSPTEIPPRCALPPFFKGGQGGISSRSVMKCANLLWSDLAFLSARRAIALCG